MIKQALLTAAANRRRLKREDRPSRRVSASAVASSITGGTTPLRRSTRPYSGPRAALGAPGLAAIARNNYISRRGGGRDTVTTNRPAGRFREMSRCRAVA